MGLLPSQEYDFVLESFREYLQYNEIVFGEEETKDKHIIEEFLNLCDEKIWEI